MSGEGAVFFLFYFPHRIFDFVIFIFLFISIYIFFVCKYSFFVFCLYCVLILCKKPLCNFCKKKIWFLFCYMRSNLSFTFERVHALRSTSPKRVRPQRPSQHSHSGTLAFELTL
jgi:hypothetical protein